MINNDSIPLFSTPVARITFYFFAIFYTTGFWCNLTLVFLWWRHRREDMDPFSIFIIVTDCISGSSSFVFIYVSAYMSWAESGLGKKGCAWAGAWSWVCSLLVLFSIFIYGFQRYLIISGKKSLDMRKTTMAYISFMCITSVVAYLPYLFGEEYSLAPSGAYCLMDWSKNTPGSLLFIVYTAAIGLFFFCGFFLFYFRIISTLTSLTKRISGLKGKSPASTEKSSETQTVVTFQSGNNEIVEENVKREKTLVKRVVILLGSYMIAFLPFTYCILYESITGMNVPPVIDGIAADAVVANTCIDFLIFVTINSFYKKLFWDLFRRRNK